MAALLAHYDVEDLERFRKVFDGFEVTRFRSGATGHRLLREDDNHVVVLIEFEDADKARAFAALPERQTALDEAGVTRRDDHIVEELEQLRY